MIQVLSNPEGETILLRLFREREDVVCCVTDREAGKTPRVWSVPFSEFEALCAGETRRLEAGDLGFENVDGAPGDGLRIEYEPTHPGGRRRYAKHVECGEVERMAVSL